MSYALGIWMVGSLLWEESCVRSAWRDQRLNREQAVRTVAPIRYGRRSVSRDDTFTIVFSEELSHSEEQMGRAFVVPCRKSVQSPDELIEEAEALWAAERKAGQSNGRISATWGCVALMANPALEREVLRITKSWAARVAHECGYEVMGCASSENPVVDGAGLLAIPWPRSADGRSVELDLIIATATCPTLNNGQYASPDEIADRWLKNPAQAEYFWNNREHGIETFQDQEIAARLCEAHGAEIL